MNITPDENQFHKKRIALLREMVTSFKRELEEAGVREEAIYDLTGRLAFSVGAILDGSRVMDCDGKPLIPYLAFAENSNRKTLVIDPNGSRLHECANGVT